MFPFSRRRRLPGWLAVCQRESAFEMAHVIRGADGGIELKSLSTFPLIGSGEKAPWETLLQMGADKTLALRDYRCTTLLSQGSYQLLQVEAPDVPEAEQKEALRWRLKDLIEYPVDSVGFDIIPLPDAVMGGRTRQLFAAVARNDVIEPVVAGFHAAKLNLEVIDLPEMAQRNISALFEDENRALAFLAFDDSSALLTFTYKGELFSLRRIEVGSQQLLNANEERRAQLAERVVLELQRSIDGVDRQFSSISLSRMIISLPPDCGLEEQLRDGLYIPFEPLDLAKVMDISAVPELASAEAQRRSLKTIGAALRQDEVES